MKKLIYLLFILIIAIGSEGCESEEIKIEEPVDTEYTEDGNSEESGGVKGS